MFGIISSTTQPFCSDCDAPGGPHPIALVPVSVRRRGVDRRNALRSGASAGISPPLIDPPGAAAWSRRRRRLSSRDRTPLIPWTRFDAIQHLEMHTRGAKSVLSCLDRRELLRGEPALLKFAISPGGSPAAPRAALQPALSRPNTVYDPSVVRVVAILHAAAQRARRLLILMENFSGRLIALIPHLVDLLLHRREALGHQMRPPLSACGSSTSRAPRQSEPSSRDIDDRLVRLARAVGESERQVELFLRSASEMWRVLGMPANRQRLRLRHPVRRHAHLVLARGHGSGPFWDARSR